MLSYDDALAHILAAIPEPTASEPVALKSARGRVLAEDLFAAENLPSFANSAVDGFAVRFADVADARPERPVRIRVTQTIAAGFPPDGPIHPGEGARILTGAIVPNGCERIVMVEDSRPVVGGDGEFVDLTDPGSAGHVRPAGSDIPVGARAVSAGVALEAGEIGVLAALNQAQVPCRRRPRVGLIVTGDEIVTVGTLPLALGQIRNSNGPALVAAIAEAGGEVVFNLRAGDTIQATREALRACVGCDVIVSTGGVSVGTYDYVKAAVEEVGTLDFWRIAIKPGKPLAFGRLGSALFFGLPGNPVSSLVTFELFVRPALRRLGGFAQPLRRVVSVTLVEPVPHTPGRREFIRASLTWENGGFTAMPTGAQGSHRLSSLLVADAYLIAHEDHDDYATGETLPALLLRA